MVDFHSSSHICTYICLLFYCAIVCVVSLEKLHSFLSLQLLTNYHHSIKLHATYEHTYVCTYIRIVVCSTNMQCDITSYTAMYLCILEFINMYLRKVVWTNHCNKSQVTRWTSCTCLLWLICLIISITTKYKNKIRVLTINQFMRCPDLSNTALHYYQHACAFRLRSQCRIKDLWFSSGGG